MNLDSINKWLDEEYGVSYTRLEELHDFYFKKYTDQKEVINKIKKILKADGIVEDIYYALCMLFKFEGYDDETMINQKLRNILKGDE